MNVIYTHTHTLHIPFPCIPTACFLSPLGVQKVYLLQQYQSIGKSHPVPTQHFSTYKKLQKAEPPRYLALRTSDDSLRVCDFVGNLENSSPILKDTKLKLCSRFEYSYWGVWKRNTSVCIIYQTLSEVVATYVWSNKHTFMVHYTCVQCLVSFLPKDGVQNNCL